MDVSVHYSSPAIAKSNYKFYASDKYNMVMDHAYPCEL